MEDIKWKFKKDIEPQGSSSGFWYALTDGGHIRPDELLDDKDQLKKLNEAIDIVTSFQNAGYNSGVVEEY